MTRVPGWLWMGCALVALLAAGCAGPRAAEEPVGGADPEFVRLSQLGREAYARGTLDRAEALYREARRRAAARDAAGELADAAYNLAAVLLAAGRGDEAKPLLDEAEAASEEAGRRPLEVWLVQAKRSLADGAPEDARRWLDAVGPGDALDPVERVQLALLRGELAVLEADAAAARRQLVVAREAGHGERPSLAAQRARLEGRIALLEGRPADAVGAFGREADRFRDAGQLRAMADALARAAAASAEAGELASAARFAYRAARSLLAQDLPAAARPLLTQALAWSAETGETALQHLLETLAREAGMAP